MKPILNEIVNRLESLALSLDALESALIHRGQLRYGEIQEFSGQHALKVAEVVAGLRIDISALPE